MGSPSHTVSTSESEPVLQVSATPYTRYPQRGSATVVGVSSEGPRVAHLEAHVSLTEAGRARVKPTDLSEEFPTSVSYEREVAPQHAIWRRQRLVYDMSEARARRCKRSAELHVRNAHGVAQGQVELPVWWLHLQAGLGFRCVSGHAPVASGARHHARDACISLSDTHFWVVSFCDPF